MEINASAAQVLQAAAVRGAKVSLPPLRRRRRLKDHRILRRRPLLLRRVAKG